jgi:arginase family enzyme
MAPSTSCRSTPISISSTFVTGCAKAGSTILSVRQMRKLGADAVLAGIPNGGRYYVTIDIDGFDPSNAPGTGTQATAGSCITK